MTSNETLTMSFYVFRDFRLRVLGDVDFGGFFFRFWSLLEFHRLSADAQLIIFLVSVSSLTLMRCQQASDFCSPSPKVPFVTKSQTKISGRMRTSVFARAMSCETFGTHCWGVTYLV